MSNTARSKDLDFDQLAPQLRRPLLMFRNVCAVIATVGALAFILHAAVFYIAFKTGAPAPTGAQSYRIASHSDKAYVQYGIAVTIFVLEVVFVAGLGIGVAGGLAADAIARRLSRRACSKPSVTASSTDSSNRIVQ